MQYAWKKGNLRSTGSIPCKYICWNLDSKPYWQKTYSSPQVFGRSFQAKAKNKKNKKKQTRVNKQTNKQNKIITIKQTSTALGNLVLCHFLHATQIILKCQPPVCLDYMGQGTSTPGLLRLFVCLFVQGYIISQEWCTWYTLAWWIESVFRAPSMIREIDLTNNRVNEHLTLSKLPCFSAPLLSLVPGWTRESTLCKLQIKCQADVSHICHVTRSQYAL